MTISTQYSLGDVEGARLGVVLGVADSVEEGEWLLDGLEVCKRVGTNDGRADGAVLSSNDGINEGEVLLDGGEL